jgi:hypothetical protein
LKVKYRIVEERTPDDGWETVGVIIWWESAPPHLRLSGVAQHTVSTSIWKVVLQRVKDRQLTLETYHEALEGFERDYQILPEIYELEADTAAEIRKQLRDQYVYGNVESAAQPVAA